MPVIPMFVEVLDEKSKTYIYIYDILKRFCLKPVQVVHGKFKKNL